MNAQGLKIRVVRRARKTEPEDVYRAWHTFRKSCSLIRKRARPAAPPLLYYSRGPSGRRFTVWNVHYFPAGSRAWKPSVGPRPDLAIALKLPPQL